jgi:hypothetical protein
MVDNKNQTQVLNVSSNLKLKTYYFVILMRLEKTKQYVII